MGKQKEAATTTTSTRSTSSRAKRKEPTDQPAAQRKKQKKAEPAAAPAAETKPKKDQKKPSSSSGTNKKDKKPTKPQPKKAAAEQKPKRQSKKQKQEEQEEPEKSMHDIFMEEIHAKEAELKLHCLVLGQVGWLSGPAGSCRKARNSTARRLLRAPLEALADTPPTCHHCCLPAWCRLCACMCAYAGGDRGGRDHAGGPAGADARVCAGEGAGRLCRGAAEELRLCDRELDSR